MKKENRVISALLSLFIFIPLFADEFLLSAKTIEGTVLSVGPPRHTGKGPITNEVMINEKNRFPVGYSVNPGLAEIFEQNKEIILYETKLLYRIIAVEKNGVKYSNYYSRLNLFVWLSIFCLPIFSAYNLWRWFKGKY